MDLHIAVATVDDVDDAARLFDAYRQFYGRPSDRSAAQHRPDTVVRAFFNKVGMGSRDMLQSTSLCTFSFYLFER